MIQPLTNLTTSPTHVTRTSDSSVPADRTASAAGSPAPDKVELSDRARRAANGPHGIRSELVQRLRAAIANNTYLTDDKLEQAIDRLTREAFGSSTVSVA